MMCLKIVFNFQIIKLKILYIFIMDVLKLILNLNKKYKYCVCDGSGKNLVLISINKIKKNTIFIEKIKNILSFKKRNRKQQKFNNHFDTRDGCLKINYKFQPKNFKNILCMYDRCL